MRNQVLHFYEQENIPTPLSLLCAPGQFSPIPRRLPFAVVCLNQVFWGVYFFPSFVLVRVLWALRQLECFFVLKFVREMKADIRCACPSNAQKSENHKRKLYCSLFVVCCEYIRLGKNKLGRGTLFPIFFRRKRRGRLYYTGYSPFLQDFLNFDTGIKNSTTEKLFFNIFVIWQIEQSGIIAIKTN